MTVDDTPSAEAEFLLASHWRGLVENWARRQDGFTGVDDDSVWLDAGLPPADTVLNLRFMATQKHLVAVVTNGRHLKPDQLARAAAAANAWNTTQLLPMLSVWGTLGPQPCLAGVMSLPLTFRVRRREFDGTADDWIERASRMFVQCHRDFAL